MLLSLIRIGFRERGCGCPLGGTARSCRSWGSGWSCSQSCSWEMTACPIITRGQRAEDPLPPSQQEGHSLPAHFPWALLNRGCQVVQGLRLAAAVEARAVCCEPAPIGRRGHRTALLGLGQRRREVKLHTQSSGSFEAGWKEGIWRNLNLQGEDSRGTRLKSTRGWLGLKTRALEYKNQQD